jgi:cell division protein FtsQ
MVETGKMGRVFRTGQQNVSRRRSPLQDLKFVPDDAPIQRPVQQAAASMAEAPLASSADESDETGGSDTQGMRKLLWLLVFIFIVLIAGQLIYQFAIAPELKIAHVQLDSPLNWDTQTLLSLAGLPEAPFFDAIDPELVAEKLSTVPIIQSATVEKIFPDTLRFHITPRSPLVQCLLGDGTVVLIDALGVVYDYVQTRTAYDIPVISGLEFLNFSLGARLPATMIPFLNDIQTLRDKAPGLYQAYSEFRLETNGGQDLEILCLASIGGVPVRISSRLSIEAAGYIIRVLQTLAATEGFGGVKELDFRSRDIIIKKGDS